MQVNQNFGIPNIGGCLQPLARAVASPKIRSRAAPALPDAVPVDVSATSLEANEVINLDVGTSTTNRWNPSPASQELSLPSPPGRMTSRSRSCLRPWTPRHGTRIR